MTSLKKNFLAHFREDKNKLEWIVFFGGLAILLALITYLAVQWARHEKEEVFLSVSWKPDPGTDSAARYEITLSNTGSKTVKQVQLKATCWRQQQSRAEDVEIVIDLSPRRSDTRAWFQFHEPVAAGDSVVVRISGYQ